MTHIHETYDFVIVAYIVHQDRVLLVEHPRYGKWLPVGGHIELDEDPEMALFREISEETGLDVEILSSTPGVQSPGTKVLVTPNGLQVHDAGVTHRHIGLIYYAAAKTSDFKRSGEHTNARWFTADELQQAAYNLARDIIFYATEAIRAARHHRSKGLS